MYNTLYGNFRQRKFTDIWGNEDVFKDDYHNCGIPTTISDESVTTLFYLLYARYGNSTIASFDETQFQYKVFAIIFQYAPAWEKRLEVQKALCGLDLDGEDLYEASRMINNHAFNPSTAPSTSTTRELEYINEQSTNGAKRGKLEAYAALMQIIQTDVTEELIAQFKSLFLTVVEPELPLWYKTEVDE